MTDHLAPLHPSEMTPAERAAVAALLAAALLRQLRPAAFPPPVVAVPGRRDASRASTG